jgi:hypothetical protein
MLRLPASLAAWGTADFAQVLKRELEAQAAQLPLQQQLSGTSHVVDAPIQVMVLGAKADQASLVARVGVFFAGVVAGCNCADDPTPVEAQPEYCELRIVLSRCDARADVLPLLD